MMARRPVRSGPQPPLIRLEGVWKTYERDGVPVTALRAVDLAIDAGEFTAIMGPSGSGKSTLLHVIGLLDADYEGTYHLAGRKVSGLSQDDLSVRRNRELGFVFQNFQLLPSLSILDNAALPALYARDRSAEACRAAASTRLRQLGLGDRLDHKPAQLSVGQRQRAAIARALVNGPRVLLADEPTGALDSKTAQEILDVFTDLHQSGVTIVLVTHDRDVASAAGRVIHVLDGQVHDGLPPAAARAATRS
jgi:putative ABC transport system ATP-binding protein